MEKPYCILFFFAFLFDIYFTSSPEAYVLLPYCFITSKKKEITAKNLK